MNVVIPAVPSPYISAVIASCTTSVGGAELTWASPKRDEDCVSQSGCGNTSMFEALTNAGNGRPEDTGKGMANSCFTHQMFRGSRRLERTAWLMKCSGAPHWSITVSIAATIRPVATRCTFMTVLTQTISEMRWRQGLRIFCDLTGRRRLVRPLGLPNSPMKQYGASEDVMLQEESASNNLPLNMGSIRPRSVPWSTGKLGVTWSESVR